MRKPLQILHIHALQAVLVCGLAITGLVVAQLVHSGFIYKRNQVQLTEMNSRLLRSAELALDYAIITLGEIDPKGLAECTAESVRAIRERIIRRGSIKDIEIRDRNGKLICGGLGLRDELVAQNANHGDGYAARNSSIHVSTVDRESEGLLRVSWQRSPALAVDAIINVDTILFDVFPPALREDAAAAVQLAGGETIARYTPDEKTGLDFNAPTERFEVSSSRYPVSSSLTVASPAIAKWNADTSFIALGLGGLLGGIIGILASRQLSKPVNPIDALRTALERHEIQPYFQPIFSLKDTSVLGCEVLMRWIPANGPAVPPDRFIPLAESSGLISPMTEAIIRDALRQLGPFLSARPDFKVAFNVTPAHFMSDSFALVFQNLVIESGVSPRQIVIELTERQSFEHAGRAAKVAAELRRMGFRLALDDMGSGHNGLSQVHELPIDIIKIDKKFVDLIDVDQVATAIVQMITGLANDLGKSTVAEGIETEAQRLKLLECGVEQGQGYLVSPALSFPDFQAYMKEIKPRVSKRKNPPQVASSAV